MSSVDRNGTQEPLDDQSLNTVHNVAFYPVCKLTNEFHFPPFFVTIIFLRLGSMNNETSWLADNTAKLYFSTHLLAKLAPNTYLHNAKLR